MPRNYDSTLETVHKRIDSLLKRVEKLDREVFKAIRIDADCVTPDMTEELTKQQTEIARVVMAMVRPAKP